MIAETIRDNELDGATILSLDENDVKDLGKTGLDQKKLLGIFRETIGSLPSPTPTKKTRIVFRGAEYDAAWERLNESERELATSLGREIEARIRAIEDLLASYLLDPKNQTRHPRYGQRPMLHEAKRQAERQPALDVLKSLQTNQVKTMHDHVQAIIEKTYETSPKASFVINGGAEVCQPIESCFEGREVVSVVDCDEWTRRVQDTLRRANDVVSDPAFKEKKSDSFYNPSDPIFLAIKLDNRDRRTTSMTWLYAEHLLICETFHAEVDRALSPLVELNKCTVLHAQMKSSDRAKAKTAVGGDFGRLTAKPCTRFLKDVLRCSIICSSNAALDEAYDHILRNFAAAGPPKDRRHEMPFYDFVIYVFCKDLVAEIQFHFAPVFQLKALADLSYDISRVDTSNFQGFDKIFHFPSIHLEKATRRDVYSKLKF